MFPKTCEEGSTKHQSGRDLEEEKPPKELVAPMCSQQHKSQKSYKVSGITGSCFIGLCLTLDVIDVVDIYLHCSHNKWKEVKIGGKKKKHKQKDHKKN